MSAFTGDLPVPGVNADAPSAARIYNLMLDWNDDDAYPIDRATAEEVFKLDPDAALTARANHHWLRETVKYLAEQGIDQFLDIGSGLPTQDNVHQVAQRTNPEARVVYVDNDITALARARALLAGDEQTAFLYADVRDPDRILNAPETRRLLDFDRPIALLFVAVLHFVADSDNPAHLVERFVERAVPGSWLALVHVTHEGASQTLIDRINELYRNAPAPLRMRSVAQIRQMFGWAELIPPGLVPPNRWFSEENIPADELTLYAGLGRL